MAKLSENAAKMIPVIPKTPIELVIEKLLAEREANMAEEAKKRR